MSPASALGTATNQLQATGSAQDRNRTEKLVGTHIREEDRSENDVQIAHFDVDNATEKYTDQLNAFDTFIEIERGYAELMRYMRKTHQSLSFFVGGDNIIAVCPPLRQAEYTDAIDHVEKTADVKLKTGVGRAATAQQAGIAAKHALEICRDKAIDVRIE